jgi:hypothetical protein
MITGKKHFAIYVGIVAIVIGIGLLFIFNNPQKIKQAKIEPFALGTVTKISDPIVYFDVEGQEKTVTVGQNTKIVKQVNDTNGLLKVVNAKFVDIKKGSQIVVYYSTDKIQIINE